MKNCYLICLVIGIELFLIPNIIVGQDFRWNFGLGLRPQEPLADLWVLIGKKNLSARYTIRSGIGGQHKAFEQIHDYHNQTDYEFGDHDSYYFSYEYTKVTSISKLNYFIGAERKFRWNNIPFFMAIDLMFNYLHSKEKLGEDLYFQWNAPPYIQNFDVARFDQIEMLSPGVRFSLGVEYFILPQISVAIEGGVSYQRNFITTDKTIHNAYLGHAATFLNSEFLPEKKQTYSLDFSLIRLITLQYNWR